LRTPLDGLFRTLLTEESLAAVRARFDENHARIHGHAAKERPVELVSYRLRVRVSVPKYQPVPEPAPASPRPIESAIKGRRRIHLAGKESANAILYERERLDIGAAVSGPAIIEQLDATTVIPPGWSARVDAYRNLILRSE
jgi:N-methylhydantoinase A